MIGAAALLTSASPLPRRVVRSSEDVIVVSADVKNSSVGEAVDTAEIIKDVIQARKALTEATEVATEESLREAVEASTQEAVIEDVEVSDDRDTRTDLEVVSEIVDTSEVSTEEAVVEAAEARTDEIIVEATESITELPVEANKVRSEVIAEERNEAEDTSDTITEAAVASTEAVEISTDVPVEENKLRSDVDVSTDEPVVKVTEVSTEDFIINEAETSTDVPEEINELRNNLPTDDISEDLELTEAVTEIVTENEKSENELRKSEIELVDNTTMINIEPVEVSTDNTFKQNEGKVITEITKAEDDQSSLLESSDPVEVTTMEAIIEAAESSTDVVVEENEVRMEELLEVVEDYTVLPIEENEVRTNLDHEEMEHSSENSEASTDETPIEVPEASTDNSSMAPRDDIENKEYWSLMNNDKEAIEEVTVESELEKVALKYGLKTTLEVSYAAEDEEDESPSNSSNVADIRETEEDNEKLLSFTSIEDKKETEKDSQTENSFATLEEEKEEIIKPAAYVTRLTNKEDVKEDKKESSINRFKTDDETRNELKRKRKFFASRFSTRNKADYSQ